MHPALWILFGLALLVCGAGLQLINNRIDLDTDTMATVLWLFAVLFIVVGMIKGAGN